MYCVANGNSRKMKSNLRIWVVNGCPCYTPLSLSYTTTPPTPLFFFSFSLFLSFCLCLQWQLCSPLHSPLHCLTVASNLLLSRVQSSFFSLLSVYFWFVCPFTSFHVVLHYSAFHIWVWFLFGCRWCLWPFWYIFSENLMCFVASCEDTFNGMNWVF